MPHHTPRPQGPSKPGAQDLRTSASSRVLSSSYCRRSCLYCRSTAAAACLAAMESSWAAFRDYGHPSPQANTFALNAWHGWRLKQHWLRLATPMQQCRHCEGVPRCQQRRPSHKGHHKQHRLTAMRGGSVHLRAGCLKKRALAPGVHASGSQNTDETTCTQT